MIHSLNGGDNVDAQSHLVGICTPKSCAPRRPLRSVSGSRRRQGSLAGGQRAFWCFASSHWFIPPVILWSRCGRQPAAGVRNVGHDGRKAVSGRAEADPGGRPSPSPQWPHCRSCCLENTLVRVSPGPRCLSSPTSGPCCRPGHLRPRSTSCPHLQSHSPAPSKSISCSFPGQKSILQDRRCKRASSALFLGF